MQVLNGSQNHYQVRARGGTVYNLPPGSSVPIVQTQGYTLLHGLHRISRFSKIKLRDTHAEPFRIWCAEEGPRVDDIKVVNGNLRITPLAEPRPIYVYN